MEKRNSELIREIVKLRTENEKLEEQINFFQMENFDYALKCNHLDNVLENKLSITKTCPGKLLETIDDMCKVLQIHNKDPALQNRTVMGKKELQPLKKTNTNKAHVVKPHMVNGHILYVPTINLTRVSDLQTQTNTPIEKNLVVGLSNTEANNASHSSTNNNNNNNNDIDINSPELSREFVDENQLSNIEEVSEPSTSTPKSPSHSTVLSGTFQEVKIYLNQINSDSLQDESNISNRLTQRKTTKRSKTPSKRSDDGFDHVTRRRRT